MTDDDVTIRIPRSAFVALASVLAPFLAAVTVPPKEPAPVLFGSRDPYPPPPGKSHRWLREHGPELGAFGAVRSGGKRGRSVAWTIPSEGWGAYQASLAAPTTKPGPAPTIDPKGWIRASGQRLTAVAANDEDRKGQTG